MVEISLKLQTQQVSFVHFSAHTSSATVFFFKINFIF